MAMQQVEVSTSKALASPEGNVVTINEDLISKAIEMSRNSPRKRIIFPFHKSDSDTLHRMLNAIQLGSYIQPHRHITPPKGEGLVVLRGTLGYVTFTEKGDVEKYFILSANTKDIGIDIQPGVYHTFLALEQNTVLFEVKPGPYDQNTDKDFAPWAPEEGSQGSAEYLLSLERIFYGER